MLRLQKRWWATPESLVSQITGSRPSHRLFSFNALIFIVFILAAGCSTYQSNTQPARNAFYQGDYDKAAELLAKNSEEDSKDQLLYLLDRAMALQLANKFKESENDFLLADRMTDIKDYTSISTEAATLLTNDNIKQYKGEDFEKVLINAFLAVDYVLQNNYEDALVECRRVNEKLYKYKFEAKRNYEQNPFARYLSAMIWEASGHPEDAYIDYKATYDLVPGFAYLRFDVVRLAKLLGRDDDLKTWQKEFGVVQVPLPKQDRSTGEIVLIYQQGKSAVKRPHPGSPRFPKFFHRASFTEQARLEVDGGRAAEVTHEIYSVSNVAIKTLDDAYAGLVAKRLAGVAVKAVVADQIAQRNQLLGMLAWIGLNAADRADLRHWESLPDTLQFARLHVAPGSHTIRVVGLSSAGQPTGEEKVFADVHVEAGKKVFLNWRSVR